MSLLLGWLRLHVPTLLQGIGRVDAQQLGLQFQARLSSIGSQMSTLMNPENESIATAVEWLMDSVYMENQTVSFLAVCIGLESILGDQDHHMNDMTSRLCDRLGYLLGKDRSERIKLSSEYRKVLDLRGRLVHSKRSRLSDSDKHVLDSAKSLLERSILRELELASA